MYVHVYLFWTDSEASSTCNHKHNYIHAFTQIRRVRKYALYMYMYMCTCSYAHLRLVSMIVMVAEFGSTLTLEFGVLTVS